MFFSLKADRAPQLKASVGRNFLSAVLSNIGRTMRPTLFKLGTLAISLTIGVAIFLFFANHRSDEAVIPPVENPLSTKCPDDLINKGQYLVISVPNDDEFYIGKQKVELSEISTKIRQMLGNADFCDRIVRMKYASSVKSQTLDLIARQAKEADINRIEFVLDKKKRGGKQ